MINIAICDDDKVICSELENIMLEYAKSHFLQIEIDIFYSGESLLEYIEQENHLDILYLDIEMGQMNGVEVGRQIRETYRDHSIEIIYVSANDGYDRQLFDVQPLHFISKPIDKAIVERDLELALDRGKKLSGSFIYKKGYDTYKVPISDIVYFESLNREIKIVASQGEDTFYSSFSEVLPRVMEHQFVQIHRSYVINFNQVKTLRYSEVIMSNGDTLPISKSKRDEIRSLQMSEI